MTIQSLPIVGTSWYERGFVYWTRRIGMAVILAFVAVIYPIMIEAAIGDISPSGSALYDGLMVGEIVFTVVTAVWVFRRAWRNMINGKGATRRDTRRASRAAGSIGLLAYVAGGVVAGLAVFASLLTAGFFFAAFALWLVPYPPMEQYERRRIAQRIQVSHKLDQLRPRSKHYGSKSHRNSH